MLLFFDTETTGLPLRWGANWSDAANWPRIVTIAWMVTDGAGRELREQHCVVRPDGFTVPPKSTEIHGVTHAAAVATGVPWRRPAELFAREVYDASVVIAHNYRFDAGVIGAEYFRMGWLQAARWLDSKLWLCTMLASVPVCKLPSRRRDGEGDYKWPSLAEMHRHLFGTDPDVQHNAMADVRSCARCFFEMRRRNLLADYGPVRAAVAEPTP
jgi:DNA polymerase III subunit epsilon